MRMSSAKMPPSRKQSEDRSTRYITPMRLWSRVSSHDLMRGAVGRVARARGARRGVERAASRATDGLIGGSLVRRASRASVRSDLMYSTMRRRLGRRRAALERRHHRLEAGHHLRPRVHHRLGEVRLVGDHRLAVGQLLAAAVHVEPGGADVRRAVHVWHLKQPCCRRSRWPCSTMRASGCVTGAVSASASCGAHGPALLLSATPRTPRRQHHHLGAHLRVARPQYSAHSTG